MAMTMATDATLKRLASRAARNPAGLAADVVSLQTADKFRLAGLLLDAGKPHLAEAVGTRACQEIQLALLLGKQ